MSLTKQSTIMFCVNNLFIHLLLTLWVEHTRVKPVNWQHLAPECCGWLELFSLFNPPWIPFDVQEDTDTLAYPAGYNYTITETHTHSITCSNNTKKRKKRSNNNETKEKKKV